jgi:hypothetical protein
MSGGEDFVWRAAGVMGLAPMAAGDAVRVMASRLAVAASLGCSHTGELGIVAAPDFKRRCANCTAAYMATLAPDGRPDCCLCGGPGDSVEYIGLADDVVVLGTCEVCVNKTDYQLKEDEG